MHWKLPGTMELPDFSPSVLCITQAQEGSEKWERKEYWFEAVGPRDGTVARSPVLCLMSSWGLG